MRFYKVVDLVGWMQGRGDFLLVRAREEGFFLQRCMYFDFCDEGKMCLIDYYKEGKMCTLYIGVFLQNACTLTYLFDLFTYLLLYDFTGDLVVCYINILQSKLLKLSWLFRW